MRYHCQFCPALTLAALGTHQHRTTKRRKKEKEERSVKRICAMTTYYTYCKEEKMISPSAYEGMITSKHSNSEFMTGR